jgi:hypothetical protein
MTNPHEQTTEPDDAEPMSECSCYTCGRQLTEFEADQGDGNCADCFQG